MGFTGIIRGGLCWVQGKYDPTCMRENSEKSSASFDHCSSCYQISLLDLALQDSREETAADKPVLLLGLAENWEVSKLGCQASLEVGARGSMKWRSW